MAKLLERKDKEKATGLRGSRSMGAVAKKHVQVGGHCFGSNFPYCV
jgi:hypothetical protein